MKSAESEKLAGREGVLTTKTAKVTKITMGSKWGGRSMGRTADAPCVFRGSVPKPFFVNLRVLRVSSWLKSATS